MMALGKNVCVPTVYLRSTVLCTRYVVRLMDVLVGAVSASAAWVQPLKVLYTSTHTDAQERSRETRKTDS